MPKARNSGKGISFLLLALEQETDECILYPYYVMPNGYAQFGTFEGMKLVHRYVCEAAHGPPPTKRHQATHKCKPLPQRHCVNKRHLKWGTQTENETDKHSSGTWYKRISAAKVTEQQVRNIRTEHALGFSYKLLWERHKVPISTLKKIVNRKTWKHIT